MSEKRERKIQTDNQFGEEAQKKKFVKGDDGGHGSATVRTARRKARLCKKVKRRMGGQPPRKAPPEKITTRDSSPSGPGNARRPLMIQEKVLKHVGGSKEKRPA